MTSRFRVSAKPSVHQLSVIATIIQAVQVGLLIK
jgi:hypothetical protein